MEAPLLKRRLNPFLLASIVLVLSLLAGLSVIYQGQLSNLLSENKDLSSDLEEKNERISSLQAENSELESSVRNLNTRLNQTVQESQSLEDEVDNLESENSNLQTRVNNLEPLVENLSESVENLNRTLEYICINETANNLTQDSEDACQRTGHPQPE